MLCKVVEHLKLPHRGFDARFARPGETAENSQRPPASGELVGYMMLKVLNTDARWDYVHHGFCQPFAPWVTRVWHRFSEDPVLGPVMHSGIVSTCP